MQYRIDQRSENELSVLGFGCMRYPRRVGVVDKDRTEQLVVSAILRGVNYFDTAYIYPQSEVVLGEILEKNGLRDKVFLATKLPHGKCRTTEDFERFFSEQLKRLRSDHIDYYLIHNLSEVAQWQRLCDLGIEAWIAAKKQSGQLAQLGFSFHGTQDDFLQLLDAYDWDIVQIQYNYLNINYQAGEAGLLRAAEKGLAVVIMEPLLGGKLATGLPKDVERSFRSVDGVRSPASWALRWLWDQPQVTVVLSGMNAQDQLDDNIACAGTARPGMLSAEESAVFEPVIKAFEDSYKVDCTGCNYCMPCPQKVNIPACFAAYNTRYTLGLVAGMSSYVTSTRPGRKHDLGPRNCTKCGACEKKCPQHIAISSELETVMRKMEPWWFRAAMTVVRWFI